MRAHIPTLIIGSLAILGFRPAQAELPKPITEITTLSYASGEAALNASCPAEDAFRKTKLTLKESYEWRDSNIRAILDSVRNDEQALAVLSACFSKNPEFTTICGAPLYIPACAKRALLGTRPVWIITSYWEITSCPQIASQERPMMYWHIFVLCIDAKNGALIDSYNCG